jgi:hypothetical protein
VEPVLRRDRPGDAPGPGDRPLVRGRRRPRPLLGGQAGRLPALVDDYYEADRYREFCDQHLAYAEDCMAEYVQSPEFDQLLVVTIQQAFPPHEHDQFIAHYRGLLAAWAADQR